MVVDANRPPSSSGRTALAEVSQWLRCPHCGESPLTCGERSVLCPAAHSFDVARQGYVSLLTGAGDNRHHGDDAPMVGARERFLDRGHFGPLESALTSLVVENAPCDGGPVVDLAGGTGHYLAAVLEQLPGSRGLTVDLSTAALKRAARVHPRAAAVAADVWHDLPLLPGSVEVVLNVFGPRNPAEIKRILGERGVLMVASAAPEHLQELRAVVGAIGVDPHKRERLNATFDSFEMVTRRAVGWHMALTHDEAADLIGMGPNAHHVDGQDVATALVRQTAPFGVTASVDVTVLRPRRA